MMEIISRKDIYHDHRSLHTRLTVMVNLMFKRRMIVRMTLDRTSLMKSKDRYTYATAHGAKLEQEGTFTQN